MNEKVVVRPLSGQEIIDATVNQIGEAFRVALKKDCFLAPHLAYAGFKLKFAGSVEIVYEGVNMKSSAVTCGERAEGEVGTGEEAISAAAPVATEYGPLPPNEVRMDNDLPVPVIVPKPQGGFEEKKIKYAKPAKK